MLRKRRLTHQWKKRLRIMNTGMVILYMLLVGLLAFYMIRYQFLAFRYLNLALMVGFGLIFVVSLWSIVTKKILKTVLIMLVLSCILSFFLLVFFKSTENLTQYINSTASYLETEMSIWVKNDSSLSNITEISKVQTSLHSDKANTDIILMNIRDASGKELQIEEVESYQIAYENLQSGTTQAMVMNSAYESLLELIYPDYASNIKKIYSYKINTTITQQINQKESTNVFTIYISGIDTYGSIATVSRSDVNILLTVNMNTHKIIITTTPRDAYVKIPDGGADQYDKLTHAGVYGVETSMKTLSNLYGIDIQYYARINFTSFLKLIDVLGGVEVSNSQSFSSEGYDFPVGEISLDSEKALVFVRERYALVGGDNDRGRNQTKVISAIINKLASFESITKFSSVIMSLENSIQTNMTLETMMKIANSQLSSSSKFFVSSQAVSGTGSTGQLSSYAMPGASLYMLTLDLASLDAAKQQIRSILGE